MPLECKICENPVDALSSVRCRKCHQLVCRSCLASDEGGTAVCTECAEAGEGVEPKDTRDIAQKNANATLAAAPPPVANESESISALRKQWPLISFIVVLAVTFLTVAFWSNITAKYEAYYLASENEAVAEDAEAALVRQGGTSVLKEMLEILLLGENHTRYRAIRVLGDIGRVEALPALRGIATDAEESELLRSEAELAIIKIEEY